MALDSKDWERIREAWEADDRDGFNWLRDRFQIDVSRQAISKRAKAEGWTKTKQLDENTQKVESQYEKFREKSIDRATVNRAQPKAQPKEQLDESPKPTNVDEIINNPTLSETEQLFVLEYLRDFNPKEAAKRAGLNEKYPAQEAYRFLQKPAVQVAVREAVAARATAIGVDGDRLMQLWADIVNADANEFAELRRIPCPWCYGKDGEPQMTIARYYAEKKKHDTKRDRILIASNNETDIGEFPSARMFEFVDPNKAPNPECHVCHGTGEEMRILHDTRKLSPRAKILFCGVESIKGDLNIVTLNKEKAIDNLAKALFLFRERDQETETESVRPEELTKRFSSTMERARRKQAAAFKERGFDESEVIDVWPEDSEGGEGNAATGS